MKDTIWVLGDFLEFADRVTGFVVELHDVDLHRDRIQHFLDTLNIYRLVHLHANNYGQVDPWGDPTVLEATFMRRDLLETESGADSPLWAWM